MKICVHAGAFHADEILGTAIVKYVHGGHVTVTRSRDSAIWAQADVLIDVGNEYDTASLKFDHHQKGFNLKRSNGVPYAAAGLVWHHYGRSYVAKVAPDLTDDLANWVFNEVDTRFIQQADSVDVGVAIPGAPAFSFSGIINDFNGTWLDDDNEDTATVAFSAALTFASVVLLNLVKGIVAEAKSISITQAASYIEDGQIIVLSQPRVPYDVYVVPHRPKVKFAVYPSARENEWSVRVIPTEIGSFSARLDLPAAWAGLRDAELAAVTGVPDSVFCHNGRFICGARSRDGALALAKLALENQN